MVTLWKGLQQQYPADGRNGKMAVRTQLQSRIAQDSVDAILITMLMALVSVVLLIACANWPTFCWDARVAAPARLPYALLWG
jgi:hypothetical protein